MKRILTVLSLWSLVSQAENGREFVEHRPEIRVFQPESYCYGHLPAVRVYVGEGPLCGSWRRKSGLKSFNFDLESKTISVEVYVEEEIEPKHSRCAAWGPIYAGAMLPHPGFSFSQGLFPDSAEWNLKLNGTDAGQLKLWSEFDPESRLSIPKCQKVSLTAEDTH